MRTCLHCRVNIAALMLSGCLCGEPVAAVTARNVCKRLEIVGVAQNCRPKSPTFDSPAEYRFDLVGPGSHGQVYVYETDEAYRYANVIFAEVDQGVMKEHEMEPYRFRDEEYRVVVMLVSSASPRAREATRKLVDNL